MPNCSELAREDEDREADVHRHRCDSLGHASGQTGLWGEIQALTAKVADLESQLETERALKRAYFQEANAMRDALNLQRERIGRAFAPLAIAAAPAV